MDKHELSTNYSPKTNQLSSPCSTDAILKVLADEPTQEFNAWGVAERLGSDRVQYIRTVLNRAAGFGKGSGSVKKTARGFYQFCADKKEPLLDQIRQSGRFGIENLVFSKNGVRHDIMGDTPPQLLTDPKGELRTITHHEGDEVSNTHQLRTSEDATGWSYRRGFPKQLRTGQEVLWSVYPNGTEMVVFSANGSGPFPLALVVYLLDELKGQGMEGEGWMRVSMELNIDDKKLTVTEPVSFMAAERQILKFYQHGGAARLEVADRRKVPYDEAFRLLLDLNDRAHGRQALKRVNSMEGMMEEVMMEQKRQSGRLENLHKKVSGMKGKQEKIT